MQSQLRLAGKIRKHHRNDVTAVPRAIAGDDHPGAIEAVTVSGSLQGNRHFSPNRNCLGGSKFDSILAKSERSGGQIKAGGGRLNGNRMEQMRAISFASAHTKHLTIALRNVNLRALKPFKKSSQFLQNRSVLRPF
jgi:hypothetical protein